MNIKTKAYTKEEIEEIMPIHLLEQAISKKLIYVHKEPSLFVATNNPTITATFEKEAKTETRLKELTKTLPKTVTMLEILDTCGIIVWYSSAAFRGPKVEKEIEEVVYKPAETPTYTEEGKFIGYPTVREVIRKTEIVRPSIKRTYPEDYIHEVSVYHKTPSVWTELQMLDFFKNLIHIALSSLSSIRHADYTAAENWHGECSQAELNIIIDLRERMQGLKIDEIIHTPSNANKACYYVAKYVPLPGITARADGDWEYYKPPGDIPVLSGNVRTISVIPKGKKIAVITPSYDYANLVKKYLIKK